MQTVIAFGFVFGLTFFTLFPACAGSESKVHVDKGLVRELLRKNDFLNLDKLVVKCEKDWIVSKNFSYFENIGIICYEMMANVGIKPNGFPRLLRYSSLLFNKGVSGGTEVTIMYKNQADVLEYLFMLLKVKAVQEDPSWSSNRSGVMRVAALFYKTFQNRFIPEFKAYPVYLNVGPPIRSEGMNVAGGDPNLIKDPKARAAYLEAIKENSRKASVNNEQSRLKKVKNTNMPRYERAMVSAYSIAPVSLEELNEYLLLGNVGLKKRSKVIREVAQNIGKEIPIGILPVKKEEADHD